MKSFGKTIQANRQKTCEFVQSQLGGIGKRCRLAARIRMANAWAVKHPKRTFAYVVTSLLLLLTVGILSNSRMAGTKGPDVAIIGNIEPLFQGFHAIQSNKDIHRQTLLELAGQGQAIRQELDSLIAKSHKSHADSIRIIRQYKQLENIVKSLKNNDKP